jgi:glycosyltransferase involved in cell wall biosynthesis
MRFGCAFITWEHHRRTRGLSRRLGFPLREIVVRGSRPQRYFVQILATLRFLVINRPRIVVAQNPSLVLALLVLFWRVVANRSARVLIDAHNEAVEPFSYNSRPILWLSRWVIRNAEYTIVTNRFLAEKVVGLGGRPLILPDPLPLTPAGEIVPYRQGTILTVLVVATYARDEPIMQILDAARRLPGVAEFRFTGNYRKLPRELVAGAPDNVTFLGYLAEDDYWEAMRRAHAVLDLTLLEDCLVCGAYESIAMGRPQILSNTKALVEHFRKGAVYSAPDADSIALALADVRSHYERLAREVAEFRIELEREWEHLAGAVIQRVFAGTAPT